MTADPCPQPPASWLTLDDWKARNYQPSFKYRVGATVDYITFVFPSPVNLKAGVRRCDIGLDARAQIAHTQQNGDSFYRVTIQEVTLEDVQKVLSYCQQIGIPDNKLLLTRIEVSLDFRAQDQCPEHLDELLQFIRFFYVPCKHIHASYRYSQGERHKESVYRPAGYDEGVRFAVSPVSATEYIGHTWSADIDADTPNHGEMCSYLKNSNEVDGKRIPLPTRQWSARLEVKLIEEGLKSVGLRTPRDLLGFNYRRALSRYFRFWLLDADEPVRGFDKLPPELRSVVVDKAEEFEAKRETPGMRELRKGFRRSACKRHQVVNERIGDALKNLKRRFTPKR